MPPAPDTRSPPILSSDAFLGRGDGGTIQSLRKAKLKLEQLESEWARIPPLAPSKFNYPVLSDTFCKIIKKPRKTLMRVSLLLWDNPSYWFL